MENGVARQVTRAKFELGRPSRQLSPRLFDFLPDGRIVAMSNDKGREGLVLVRPETGTLEPVMPELVGTGPMAVSGNRIYLVAGYADRPGGLFAYDVSDGKLTLLREFQATVLPREYVSTGELVSYATGGGETAHGFYYPPRNPGFRGPAGEAPHLVVTVHGGPTSHTTPELSLRKQFWTTRGFALFDLNYCGSTGFGRRYRHSLYPHWGSKDV